MKCTMQNDLIKVDLTFSFMYLDSDWYMPEEYDSEEAT
jgi:hypothetical protein